MDAGNNYQWSYILYEQGAVLAVAFVAVDATRYRDGTVDDFWVCWDDLTLQYSACPPPAGWARLATTCAVLHLSPCVRLGRGVYAAYHRARPRLDLRG